MTRKIKASLQKTFFQQIIMILNQQRAHLQAINCGVKREADREHSGEVLCSQDGTPCILSQEGVLLQNTWKEID